MSKFVKIENDKVVGLVSCVQNPTYWPDIFEVADDDPRYLVYAAAMQAGQPINDEEVAARAWRDAEIYRVTWLRDRHRDELELSSDTTLSADQYAELLAYIKALRDWPATAGFPAQLSQPVVPEWVASQTP